MPSNPSVAEAAARLDEAVRAVHQLPWGKAPGNAHAVLEAYYEAKQAYGLAVLEACEFEYSTALSCEKLTEVQIRWPRIRAEIEALP
jgi:hypothetical protein